MNEYQMRKAKIEIEWSSLANLLSDLGSSQISESPRRCDPAMVVLIYTALSSCLFLNYMRTLAWLSEYKSLRDATGDEPFFLLISLFMIEQFAHWTPYHIIQLYYWFNLIDAIFTWWSIDWTIHVNIEINIWWACSRSFIWLE